MPKNPLDKYPHHQVIWSTVQVDNMLITVAENMILCDAGYVKSFGMMLDDGHLDDYEAMRQYLFSKGSFHEETLRQNAINMIRGL